MSLPPPPPPPGVARRYSLAAFAFSTLVLLVAWGAIAALLHWQWQEMLQAQTRHNMNLALALKEHTLRIIDAVDQAMARIQEEVAQGTLQGQDIVRITNETGMNPHILTQLAVVGPDGRFAGSNLDPDGQRSNYVSLMDRDHVRVHLLPHAEVPHLAPMLQEGLYISLPVQGKVSGKWTIQLSRKISAPNGQVLGVVVASLHQEHFIDVYRGVQLGRSGGVVLSGLDGRMRVRVLDQERASTEQVLPAALVQHVQAQATGGLESLSSDGLQRLIGFARVGDYPLVVLAGSAVEQTLMPWRTTRNLVLVLSILLSVAVLAFVVVFVGSIRRLAFSHAQLERSEAQAQRASQAKSEFLAAMSHELRTPLTSIRGFAELIELRSQEEKVRHQAHLIRQGAEHLGALLTEILDLAKVEAGAMPLHLEPVELRPLVREITDLYRVSAVAKALSLYVHVDSDLAPYVHTDRLKLKQILGNLLSNAIKFTESGSVRVEVQWAPGGTQLLFHVSDTGPGIAEHLHELIFEKFSQGDDRVSYEHGGTGLGLSLSRALAQLLGGSLQVQSRPGEGARFTLALPVAPGEGA